MNTMYTFLVNKNLFQCLVHDETHHLFIGFPLFDHRCKDMAMLLILSIPFHYLWLKTTSGVDIVGGGVCPPLGPSCPPCDDDYDYDYD